MQKNQALPRQGSSVPLHPRLKACQEDATLGGAPGGPGEAILARDRPTNRCSRYPPCLLLAPPVPRRCLWRARGSARRTRLPTTAGDPACYPRHLCSCRQPFCRAAFRSLLAQLRGLLGGSALCWGGEAGGPSCGRRARVSETRSPCALPRRTCRRGGQGGARSTYSATSGLSL